MILSTKSYSLFKIFVLLLFFFGYNNAYAQEEASDPTLATDKASVPAPAVVTEKISASVPDVPTETIPDPAVVTEKISAAVPDVPTATVPDPAVATEAVSAAVPDVPTATVPDPAVATEAVSAAVPDVSTATVPDPAVATEAVSAAVPDVPTTTVPDPAVVTEKISASVPDVENVVAYGNLDPKAAPSDNFDLSTWKLKIPADDDENGKPDNVSENDLSMGYQNEEYFYTGPDGGLVFKCPVTGAANSKNSKYAKVELREMLRGGETSIRTKGVTKNNWVLSSAPRKDIKAAGGVDGELTVTLAINHVTTTGKKNHIGRVVIGQIHGNSDEPVRIYYRKLKHNELGAIYFAHEINHGDDSFYEMIGKRIDSSPNPIGGIALNEKFTFKIKVEGNKMWVTIIREGKEDLVQFVDMRKSGYDKGGQFLYFKTGLNHVNNSGDEDDYVQATFYKIEKTH